MMKTILKDDRCTGCHACYNACPAMAIEMKESAEGFLYPEIREELCVRCDRCREVCPVLNMPPVRSGVDTYACAAADPLKRRNSSSGGVFALLAEQTILDGGLVCGAAFDGPGHVRHILIDDLSMLDRIRGTKYVQSEIGDIYQKVGRALETGRRVLFSGTGCQVAGLKSYLGNDPAELLTVDLICHGVPSPAVWRDYLQELGSASPVAEAEFRAADASGRKTGFRFSLKNGETHCHEQKDDLYVKGFLQNLYLRSSCFSCAFKGTKRCSDLTIGDFWSALEYHPSLSDGKGVSAVLAHSEKGKALLKRILPQMNWEHAEPKEAICWNECLVESVKRTEKREQFYSRWKQEPLFTLLTDLTSQSGSRAKEKSGVEFAKRVLRKVRDLIG